MNAEERPNILLICVDQWRADCLGFAGHPTVETPHLDRLAHESTHFSQAYAATPTCVPARAALMTGLTARHNGFVGYDDHVDWRYDVTLAGLLAEAGYHTQCVGKMHVHPARQLLGFHNVVLHDGYLHRERSKVDDYGLVDDYTPWLREQLGQPNADYIDTGVGCNGYVARPWMYDEMLHPSSWVATESIDFLRRRDPTKPFFLMASFHRPHPPLDPPQHYLDRYINKELPDVVIGDWAPEDPPIRGFDSPVPTDDDQIAMARRAYYAQISHIDHHLNRLFMALYESDVLDNTAILFVADHGEMLYDHNLVAKGLPFDSSARIPFILRLPDADDRQKVRREAKQVVELRDIFPTLCELADVDVPAHIDGKSILSLCHDDVDDWRPYLHGEHTLEADSNQWLTDGNEKYIWFTQTGRELLFDLGSDPMENHDLSLIQPEQVVVWRQRLIDELAGREEGFVQHGELVVERPQSPTLANAGTFQLR